MVRIKTEVPIFLIVFDLLFQMQEKSRQSISKKSRNTQFLKIVKLDQPGWYDLFYLAIDENDWKSPTWLKNANIMILRSKS